MQFVQIKDIFICLVQWSLSALLSSNQRIISPPTLKSSAYFNPEPRKGKIFEFWIVFPMDFSSLKNSCLGIYGEATNDQNFSSQKYEN